MSMVEDDDIDDELDEEVLDDEIDDGDEGDEDAELSEVEQIAAAAGWKPKGDWKGEGHQSAADFLKSRAGAAKNAKREVKDLESRLDAIEATSRVTLDRQREQLEARAKELRRDAIKRGDADEVEAIDKVLAEETARLTEAEKGAEAPKLTALDKAYLANHAWMFGDDTLEGDDDAVAEGDEAYELYGAVFARVLKTSGDAADAHERAGKAVAKAYPHRYQDDEPRRGRRAPDLSSGRTSSRGRDVSGPDLKLPPEALAAAKDCVKRGIYGSVQEYADVYHEEKQKGRRR